MTIKTYYVSDSGNNANDGLTAGTAWATIAYALSTMDYAGSTGVNLILSGALAITANIWTITPTTDKPLVFTGPATVTISGSSAVLGNQHFTFLNITFVNNNASTAMFTSPSRSVFIGCTFQKQSGNNSYLFYNVANCTFIECMFDGYTGSAYGLLLSTFGENAFISCTMRRCSEWFVLSNGHHNRYLRCKIVDCAGGWYAYGSVMIDHCYAKIGSYSKHVINTSGYGQYVICNSVFESGGATTLFQAGTSVAKSEAVYTRSLAAGSPNIVGANGITTLSRDPYADPSALDFALSSELAAITGSDGLTPGPVQASGGGVTGFTGLSGLSGRLGT